MADNNLQAINCVCGRKHSMTPTALAVALQAMINGDGQRVMGTEIVAICVYKLLENIEHDKRRDRVRVSNGESA